MIFFIEEGDIIANKKKGGYRPNSGRKKLDTDNKRVQKQIYISKELEINISQLEIEDCKSFSKKCIWLIERGIKNLSTTREVKFIDLFAGLGGIRIGFEQALKESGLIGKSVFVSEIKDYAVDIYKQNFNGEHVWGDITKINANDIPDFDYLLAGFPCQAFSSAGNRLGFQDTRGTLFFDVARILKAKKPRGFILENVEGLVNHDNGKTFKIIYNTLTELGYNVNYQVLSSADFGLAQNRKRIYIVGSLNQEKVNLNDFPLMKKQSLSGILQKHILPEDDFFTKKLLKKYSIKELEGKSIKDKRGGKNNIHSWDFGLKGDVTNKEKKLLNLLLKQRRNKKWASIIGIEWMDGMPLREDLIRTFYDDKDLHSILLDLEKKGYLVYEYPKKKVGSKRIYDKSLEKGYNIVTGKLSFKYSKILDPSGQTPTLVATDLSHLGVPINNGIRKLTIREGLRLFGFPEYYKLDNISPSKAYDLLGNTVCIPVIKSVAKRLIHVCESENMLIHN